jgi:hypothetical protein
MAPVISNGINGTGGANTKGSQSPKMHSKVVSVNFVFVFTLRACLPRARHLDIPQGRRDLLPVHSEHPTQMPCVQAIGIPISRSLILGDLCAEFSR